eukprot:15132613-Ditylum_brightwellii.AAC.1
MSSLCMTRWSVDLIGMESTWQQENSFKKQNQSQTTFTCKNVSGSFLTCLEYFRYHNKAVKREL